MACRTWCSCQNSAEDLGRRSPGSRHRQRRQEGWSHPGGDRRHGGTRSPRAKQGSSGKQRSISPCYHQKEPEGQAAVPRHSPRAARGRPHRSPGSQIRRSWRAQHHGRLMNGLPSLWLNFPAGGGKKSLLRLPLPPALARRPLLLPGAVSSPRTRSPREGARVLASRHRSSTRRHESPPAFAKL